MSRVLHDLVRSSAEARPDAPAVQSSQGAITYGELDARANGVAHRLAELGVRTGGRVGLYVDKSIDSVVSLVGILKAGAAYVPLDPQGPPARAARILGDCGLEVLVTSRKKKSRVKQVLEENLPLESVILIDDADEVARQELAPLRVVLRDEISNEDQPPETSAAADEDLAYILYTSGSTGAPKGVAISHRASLAFVDWSRETFGLSPEDAVSSHAPFHFDLSIFDIHASFSAGAKVCLVPQGLSVFPQSLAKFIETSALTTWYSVPSVLIQLLLHGKLDERDLSALRQVLFAGEVFHPRYLRDVMAAIPSARFYNLYGPTETNVCTYYAVAEPPVDDAPIPIGQPCCGDEGFVVDEEGGIVAPGETGELLVAGPTLMSGYWGDEEKTRRVLIEGDDDLCGGRRVYRTGDLVHLRGDGHYEFHGRRDNMVKTRGYRVELGEIEAALNRHPDVTEAVVVAKPDEELGNRLEAWLIPRDAASFDEQDLKRFCADCLPQHMIPELFFVRESLPRTSTAKVDRDRLAGGRF